MSVVLLVIIAVLAVAGMGFFFYQMMETSSGQKKNKKKRREPAPVPEKDWKAVAERLEKRVAQLEQSLLVAQKDVRNKEKESLELKQSVAGAERLFAQEKIWREKEEALVKKEKEREKALELELGQTRDELHTEQGSRIKLDYEARELRTLKEALTMDVHRWSTKAQTLEENIAALSQEIRSLKNMNAELSRKKEADQWVAKGDFLQLEKLLKRARFEIELFKKHMPSSSWPTEMQPKEKLGSVSEVTAEVTGSIVLVSDPAVVVPQTENK